LYLTTQHTPSTGRRVDDIAAAEQRRERVFCFPKGLSSAQESALFRQLSGLSEEKVQQVLDELAGRMSVSQVRNPVRYCAALAASARRGQFLPELGRQVAERRAALRERDDAATARVTAIEDVGNSVPREIPPSFRVAMEKLYRKHDVDNATADLDAVKKQIDGRADGSG
jgi:hypothetical protein